MTENSIALQNESYLNWKFAGKLWSHLSIFGLPMFDVGLGLSEWCDAAVQNINTRLQTPAPRIRNSF